MNSFYKLSLEIRCIWERRMVFVEIEFYSFEFLFMFYRRIINCTLIWSTLLFSHCTILTAAKYTPQSGKSGGLHYVAPRSLYSASPLYCCHVKCQDVLLYDRESSGLTDDSYNYIIDVHCLYNYTSHHYYCTPLQHITIIY